MPTPFIMPKMDMDQEKATIIEWLKKEGDTVKKGEPVLVVETEKITSEIEAPDTGRLVNLRYHENQEAPVTEIIAFILKEGETEQDLAELTASEKGKKDQSDEKITISKAVEKRATPVARRIADAEGIDVNQVPAKSEKVTKDDVITYLEEENAAQTSLKVAATPAARRIAENNNLEIIDIQGSGPRGRVQAQDVEAHISQRSISTESINLSSMRKRIAERLTTSYQTTPHIFLTVEVDMQQSELSRKRMNTLAAKDGLPEISLTAYLLRILAWCIKRHPYLNASFHGDQIQLTDQINIGVATALEDGLIVPVIPNADQLSINELNTSLKTLTNKARNGNLHHDDIKNGTFTISNLGMFGIQSFTAIINPPQAAILAVGAIKRKPVVIDQEDTVKVRPMMTLTLGADHRVIDGAVAANFLSDLVKALETPGMILM